MLGQIGSFLLITAFVASMVATWAWFMFAKYPTQDTYQRLARGAWLTMSGTILIASGILFYLLATHDYHYAYPYRYTSKDLPVYYLFSAFWAGQEGSFLLWMMMISVAGIFVYRSSKSDEAHVMAVIAFCQIFLLSMVIGVKFGTFHIGFSPFNTLKEHFVNAPMIQQGMIPEDGNGLNDLLKNYWMVIHPPTLFVGFTLMIVPFAYAIAGLWQRRYTEWIKPALPWALLANLILIIGIVMGGYWAYETLSFGGYWAWDPVENSSLVPWLVGVAGIHTMIARRRSASSQRASIFLNILAFMLVVYSTFLTRSGILGDISVHSFVDLGLYNQLLLWILAMGILGFGLYILRYPELPKSETETATLSREFLIFSGAVVLCALAAVIILGTSSPIIGRIFRDSPSAVPISFYDQWSLPLAVLMAFLAGLGQLFWWHKMSVEKITQALLYPSIGAVISTALVMFLSPFTQQTVKESTKTGFVAFYEEFGMSFMLLLLIFSSFFALYGNALVAWKIGRGNPTKAGGSLAHIGLSVLLLGIVGSQTFKNPLNGDLQHSTPEAGGTRNNFIIHRDQTLNIEGYNIKYKNSRLTEEGYTAYQLEFERDGKKFTVEPVSYKSKREQWIQHPDIHSWLGKDLYVAVAPAAMYESPQQQAERNQSPGELKLKRGESRIIGDGKYRVSFREYDLKVDKTKLPPDHQIAIGAVLEVTDLQTGKQHVLRPIYVIMNNNEQRFLQNEIPEFGMIVGFTGMDLSKDGKDGKAKFQFEGVSVENAEDWLVVQAQEKPFVAWVWIGCITLFLGFVVAIINRRK